MTQPQTKRSTNFVSDRAAEQRDILSEDLCDCLRHLFPEAYGYTRCRSLADQYAGIDIRINHASCELVTVDLKFRKRSYRDFGLEYAHENDDGTTTIGWVADENKKPDYIGYVFKSPVYKIYLIPHYELQRAWDWHGGDWIELYSRPYHRSRNRTYWSLICPVPFEVLADVVPYIRSADRLGVLNDLYRCD